MRSFRTASVRPHRGQAMSTTMVMPDDGIPNVIMVTTTGGRTPATGGFKDGLAQPTR